MLLFHTKCNEPIKFEILGVKMIAPIFITESRGVQISTITLKEVKEQKQQLGFYCTVCDESIPIGEVYSVCEECGEKTQSNNTYISKVNGCSLCKEHGEVSPQNVIKLVDLLNWRK